MITKLEWFGCTPDAAREIQIHQTLHMLSEIKPIARASLRVEEEEASAEPFHLTLMLSMPGPDVLAHGRGHSFQHALHQLTSVAQGMLSAYAQKA
ncbi:hypothetical protein [Prosthecobacter sp.]|uniref:hypothetical protein n=1 Tax=Prosthecobacter sp. TaxID=1965333 RepID=UPI002489A2C1|nr:hypothetical protein [Prosthecobacter sp.]MDI1311823.1 hypothetical protein [Prosthecobacter sp.]